MSILTNKRYPTGYSVLGLFLNVIIYALLLIRCEGPLVCSKASTLRLRMKTVALSICKLDITLRLHRLLSFLVDEKVSSF